jgi:hypothetical protein
MSLSLVHSLQRPSGKCFSIISSGASEGLHPSPGVPTESSSQQLRSATWQGAGFLAGRNGCKLSRNVLWCLEASSKRQWVDLCRNLLSHNEMVMEDSPESSSVSHQRMPSTRRAAAPPICPEFSHQHSLWGPRTSPATPQGSHCLQRAICT